MSGDQKRDLADRLLRMVLGLVAVALLVFLLLPNIQMQSLRVLLGIGAFLFFLSAFFWGLGLPSPVATVVAQLWRRWIDNDTRK